MILGVCGDEEIVEAVVVVIPHGHAHSEHLNVEASIVRHVREGAVMIIVVELGCRVFLNVAGPVHPVDEENVRPAVVVVVNESNARPHSLRQEFLSKSAIVVNKANAGLLRDVTNLNRSSFRGGSDSNLCDEKNCY